MRLSDGELKSKITETINDCGRSPFLFLGSGFSRRYLGTPNWEGLLRDLCKEFGDDDFLYDRYKLRVEREGVKDANPAIASLMEDDLREAVLDSPRLRQFRDENIKAIRSDESLLKILAAQYISTFVEPSNQTELEELRKAGTNRISGIITTNYDCLAEEVFPGFQVFVGQDDLLFQQLYEVAEIYKIHGSITDPQSMVLDSNDYAEIQSRQDYLVAKLLTIFVEYPLIFIGYSITDPDIQGILQSLARCLSDRHLAKLKDRLIFLSRGDNDVSNRVLTFEGAGSVEMTQIATNDFGLVYRAIADSHNRFAPRVLRDLKRNVYELVDSASDKPRIQVIGLEGMNSISEDSELIIGLGSVSADRVRYGHAIKPEQLYIDVVMDDQFLAPSLVVEEVLPDKLPSNRRGLPMYKYLALYDGNIKDPNVLRLLSENTCVDDFLHGQQKKWKRSYRSRASEISVTGIIGAEGKDKAYEKLLYLESEEIDLEQMRLYLVEILSAGANVLKDNPELKRLIRVYDFLKYKDASVAAANSESPETPS